MDSSICYKISNEGLVQSCWVNLATIAEKFVKFSNNFITCGYLPKNIKTQSIALAAFLAVASCLVPVSDNNQLNGLPLQNNDAKIVNVQALPHHKVDNSIFDFLERGLPALGLFIGAPVATAIICANRQNKEPSRKIYILGAGCDLMVTLPSLIGLSIFGLGALPVTLFNLVVNKFSDIAGSNIAIKLAKGLRCCIRKNIIEDTMEFRPLEAAFSIIIAGGFLAVSPLLTKPIAAFYGAIYGRSLLSKANHLTNNSVPKAIAKLALSALFSIQSVATFSDAVPKITNTPINSAVTVQFTHQP